MIKKYRSKLPNTITLLMVNPTNAEPLKYKGLFPKFTWTLLTLISNKSPKDQAWFPLAGPPSVKTNPWRSLLILCSLAKDAVVPLMIGVGWASTGWLMPWQGSAREQFATCWESLTWWFEFINGWVEGNEHDREQFGSTHVENTPAPWW